MGNIGKCCVKGQLCPIEITAWRLAAVIFAHWHLNSGSPVMEGRWSLFLIVGWLVRLCIIHASAMHSDPDDAICVKFAF